jgi:hypothetical protein
MPLVGISFTNIILTFLFGLEKLLSFLATDFVYKVIYTCRKISKLIARFIRIESYELCDCWLTYFEQSFVGSFEKRGISWKQAIYDIPDIFGALSVTIYYLVDFSHPNGHPAGGEQCSE